MRLPGSTNFSPGLRPDRFSLIESHAVPALIAAILFFMSGGDMILIALSFVLIIWAFFATRRARARARAALLEAEPSTPVAAPAEESIDFLRAGIEWCRQVADARRVVLWSLDEGAGLVRPIAAAGGARPRAHVLHGSTVTWIARERMPARIDPAPEWAESPRVVGVSVLQEQPTHALTLEFEAGREVEPQQFEMLGIYLGALLNVTQDHLLLAYQQEQTELFLHALRALPTARDTQELAQELLPFAVRITGGTGAALTAWDGERGELVAAENAGIGAGEAIKDSESLTVLCARGAGTLAKSGSALRGLYVLAPREKLLPSADAAVAVPLIDGGDVVGVLTVWSSQPRIEESAISSLETLAPYAAARLTHAQHLGRMRELADRDALTGLANRRAFDTQLHAEWARWERYKRPFSLFLFDIDHFKRVNDQYGHDAGDDVLRAVAGALRTLLRGSDFAARHGGEEFAVLLSEAPGRTAAEIAERIRAHVEALHIIARGQHIPVTISGGVVSASEVLTPEDMVRAADQLLYRAKQGGRNRIELTRP